MRRAPSFAFIILVFVPMLAHAKGEGIYEPLELKEREQQLLKTSSDYEDLFVRRGYRYQAGELEGLVSRIGSQLAPPPTDDYIDFRFYILRDPEPNAFALPDGQIYLNTGMLALLENEAQLAGLLGHEAYHTAGHHGILSYRSARKKIIASIVLGPLTLGISDIFLSLSMFGYSRDLEEESDRMGARVMLEAGYDPREIPGLFEILSLDPEGERPKRSTKWQSHPALQARAAYTKELAAEITEDLDVSTLKVEAESYRKLVRQTSLLTVQDLIAADYPRSAIALARRLVDENETDAAGHLAMGNATHALGARAMHAAEAVPTKKEKKKSLKARIKYTREEREEQSLATPEGQENLQRNLQEARDSYRRALKLDGDLTEAHRGLGFALEGLGKFKDAGREFVLYLRARPNASDKSIIKEHLRAITDRIKKRRKADGNS